MTRDRRITWSLGLSFRWQRAWADQGRMNLMRDCRLKFKGQTKAIIAVINRNQEKCLKLDSLLWNTREMQMRWEEKNSVSTLRSIIVSKTQIIQVQFQAPKMKAEKPPIFQSILAEGNWIVKKTYHPCLSNKDSNKLYKRHRQWKQKFYTKKSILSIKPQQHLPL